MHFLYAGEYLIEEPVNTIKTVKAIIFDVDGVVFNSLDENGRYLWSKNIKSDLGICGEHFKLIFSDRWDDVTRGKTTTKDHLRSVFMHEIFNELRENGLTPDSYINYWLSHDGNINLEMIGFVKQFTIPVYLGTNQDEHRTRHIVECVGHFFTGCFASYQIGHIKTEKEFFEYIQNKLQLKPDELILIDDTKANIDGARACGWNAFLYQNNLEDLKRFIQN